MPVIPGPTDSFGAFCQQNQVALPGSGAGPLSGLRFAVKDVIHIAGTRTGFGNPDWLRTHAPPSETAECVRRLLAAGANMIGKTVTDELTYSLTGENVHYGTPRNPRDATRVPGGSSSGSAVAVAAEMVDFAIGTDCGGSVRLPASYCGIIGIRPTHGRVSTDGVLPFAPSFDVVGWFARDAKTMRNAGHVLLDDHTSVSKPKRLLFAEDAFDQVDPAIRAALAAAIGDLSGRFWVSRSVIVSPDGLDHWRRTFQTIQAGEIWRNHGAWIRETRPSFGPGISERFESASRISDEDVARCLSERAGILARMETLLEDGDILCLPTSPRGAPLRNSPLADIEVNYRNQAMSILCIAGLAGLPQVSLPVAEIDGLPLGLSIVGRRGADEMLLDLAADFLPAYATPSTR